MAVKRILHVIEAIGIGGAEILLCNTVSELKEYEHVIISLYPPVDDSILPSNATHICLNATSPKALPAKAYRYKRIVKDFKPDIVHAHLYFATIFTKLLTPSFIPLLFTQHFVFSKNTSKWYYAFFDNIVSSKKHTCLAVSEVVLKDYVKSTDFKGHTRVLGIYIPDHFFKLSRPINDQSKKGLRMVALGNIKPIKNQQYLLNAFSHLRDLPVTCDIYGEGAERLTLEHEARQKNIAVYFKGPVSDSACVLPQYDLYIMPSLTEGFPLALFEAMAASLPVIVSDIPVFHELLGEQGEYFSLQDTTQLRGIIEKYMQQTDLLLTRGMVMKKIALQKASRENYLRQLREVYTQAMT